MRLAAASDHAGLSLKRELVESLRVKGHEVTDLGPQSEASVDYPDFAKEVSGLVAAGKADLGLLVCGSGTGMAISANKVHGIRAATARSEYEAKLARQHNDVNVLCLGQRITGSGLAAAIVDAFLGAAFEGGRHQARVDKIKALEEQR
jgi:ribose 5-phosphate isomerase B